ncbi:MAG: hypothetical protein PHH82_02865 [Candidatus ainarchaeum sp.]|nr:hypothetical protein [Candidatus ainarchaeum sp.]
MPELPKFKAEYRKLKDGELGARQNRKAFLRERRRELERAGLKKRQEITTEKAEEFFKKRYGVEYNEQIKSLLGQKYNPQPENTHKSGLETVITSAIQSKEKTLFLFPLTGQLFTFYFMRGLIEELRKQGVTNISATTIITPAAAAPSDLRGLPAIQEKQALIKQAGKIYASTKPKKIIMIDFVDFGLTKRRLESAFKEHNTSFEHLNFVGGQAIGKQKLYPRKVINKTVDLTLRYNLNPKTIREILFFAGRFFVHTHLNPTPKK